MAVDLAVGPARPRRHHQRRRPVAHRQERVGPALGKDAHDPHVGVLRGEQERRRPGQRPRQHPPVGGPRHPAALRQANVRIGAVGQQGLDQGRVGAQHRGVQGGIARAGRVRIGAAAQQVRGQLAVAAEARDDQGRGAVGRRLVHVGAGVEQQPRALHAPLPRREQQRREAAQRQVPRAVGAPAAEAHEQRAGLGARVHVGPVVDEQPHDPGMPLGHRPHQRGLSP